MKRTRASVLDHFREHGRGAEIGVFMAGFSQKILNQVKPTKLYLVDPWVNFDDPGLDKSWYKDGSEFDMDAIHDKIAAKYDKRIKNGQVEILRGTSEAMLPKIGDDSLDFVYIDGDHRYEAVRLDIALAWPKLVEGGVMAVDDHVTGYWWQDGVVRAVNEFLGANARTAQIVACDENQVVIRKHAPVPDDAMPPPPSYGSGA
ncbi:MAG: Methyltransferase domain [Rhodobacteraceae bacterium HLUCCA08]|nr:MAG: Methyltransferase domain [Rhodobacteraceae bacterium HLUCCA08]